MDSSDMSKSQMFLVDDLKASEYKNSSFIRSFPNLSESVPTLLTSPRVNCADETQLEFCETKQLISSPVFLQTNFEEANISHLELKVEKPETHVATQIQEHHVVTRVEQALDASPSEPHRLKCHYQQDRIQPVEIAEIQKMPENTFNQYNVQYQIQAIDKFQPQPVFKNKITFNPVPVETFVEQPIETPIEVHTSKIENTLNFVEENAIQHIPVPQKTFCLVPKSKIIDTLQFENKSKTVKVPIHKANQQLIQIPVKTYRRDETIVPHDSFQVQRFEYPVDVYQKCFVPEYTTREISQPKPKIRHVLIPEYHDVGICREVLVPRQVPQKKVTQMPLIIPHPMPLEPLVNTSNGFMPLHRFMQNNHMTWSNGQQDVDSFVGYNSGFHPNANIYSTQPPKHSVSLKPSAFVNPYGVQ